jgi:hypothetical protein
LYLFPLNDICNFFRQSIDPFNADHRSEKEDAWERTLSIHYPTTSWPACWMSLANWPTRQTCPREQHAISQHQLIQAGTSLWTC